MPGLEHFVSPRRAAQALGVSESSLKRWCDRGLIESVRTGGGHRKLSAAAVLRFVREHDYRLVAPEVLGLEPLNRSFGINADQARDALVATLLAGNDSAAQQILFGLYLARRSLAEIFDLVVAAAFQDIGERWACRQVQIYQERRACEICGRILLELRHLQTVPPATAPLVIGGTMEGDPYTLPTTMIELVLREAGLNAVSLGVSIPAESLAAAVHDLAPSLFWLSVSHIADGPKFLHDFSELTAACQARRIPLVVGGRGLTALFRRQLVYSAFCDTLEQLTRLVGSFLDPNRRATLPQDHSTTLMNTRKDELAS